MAFSPSNRCVVYFMAVLVFISLIANDVEHLLFVIFISPLMIDLFKCFVYGLIG